MQEHLQGSDAPEVRRVMIFRYFFTPVGSEYFKKLGRSVGIGLAVVFGLWIMLDLAKWG